MPSRLGEIFDDPRLVERIKMRLPHLFTLAEIESSRAGKVGMEVGSVREKILIALLIYKFGEENVEVDIPITQHDVDIKLFGHPVSIKTISGAGGVKVSWTVDAQKAAAFLQQYTPQSDVLLARVIWVEQGASAEQSSLPGGLFFIPLEVQGRVFRDLGRQRYLKLPKPGTNPRGSEISKEALTLMTKDGGIRFIGINWIKSSVGYNPYSRWIEAWRE